MEVISKDLRHHATLVAAIILIAFAVSISIAGHNMKALASRPFNIQPSKDGLAKITSQESSGSDWAHAGQETELTLSLH